MTFSSLLASTRNVLLATCLVASFGSPALAQGQPDNLGTEFFLGLLPNPIDGAPITELHLTAPTATTVRVRYPYGAAPVFDQTFMVVPGTVSIVTIPDASSTNWTADAVSMNAIHAEADEEFVAYLINRREFTSDAALGLPVDVLNSEYLLMSYPSVAGSGGQFLVVAPFDNTVLTITPTTALVGRPAGVPFNVMLNRGEAYFGTTPFASGDVTGTAVSSTRPVYVSNGSFCANVPSGITACDHIFETAHPLQTWGQDVLIANLPMRPGGSIYRILASADNTNVQLDGMPLAMLNRGQFFETMPLPGVGRITADQPIFVTQYMTGQSSPGATLGDPAMGNLIPCEQFQTDYTFSTVGGMTFAQNFLTVYANNLDVGSIVLDGTAIPAASFTAIPGSNFSAATVNLTDGTHSTSSSNPHGITVEGYNGFNSYIYPGGALFDFINPVGDANPPICSLTFDQMGPSLAGVATDDRPSEDVNMNGVLDPGEDLNMNGQIDNDTGIFSVALDPSSTGVSLQVAPFVPGDDMVNFTVSLLPNAPDGNAVVVIEDGAGNATMCSSAIGCNGLVERVGVDNPGTGGLAPRIDTGCPQINSMRVIEVTDALPMAHGCLLAGFNEIATPIFPGVNLYVDAVSVIPHDSDGTGSFSLPVAYPNDPTLVGGVFLVQSFYIDPGATGNISVTEALRITIGDDGP